MSDDPLLQRIRKALAPRAFTEQKMFGGVCFMVDGNMLVGSSKRGLLVRVGKDAHGAALAQPHAQAMEMRGRPMEGYVFVDPARNGFGEGPESVAQARARLRGDPPAQGRKAGKAKPKRGGRSAT